MTNYDYDVIFYDVTILQHLIHFWTELLKK